MPRGENRGKSVFLSPQEYEAKLRKPHYIPMQHPTGHIRWVDPKDHNRLVAFGYKDCDVVEETVQKAVPKQASAIPPQPVNVGKKGA